MGSPRDQRRRRKVYREVPRRSPPTGSEWLLSQGRNVFDKTDHEHDEQIREALENLRPQDREFLMLRFWYGYTLQAIGEMVGVTKQAAHQREQRALAALRELLEDTLDV